MRRPTAARETLSFSPLVQARRTHAASIKGIARMTALAQPAILLARRPAAQRAADARAGGTVVLVEIGFSVDYCGCGAHARILSRTCFGYPTPLGRGRRVRPWPLFIECRLGSRAAAFRSYPPRPPDRSDLPGLFSSTEELIATIGLKP